MEKKQEYRGVWWTGVWIIIYATVITVLLLTFIGVTDG